MGDPSGRGRRPNGHVNAQEKKSCTCFRLFCFVGGEEIDPLWSLHLQLSLSLSPFSLTLGETPPEREATPQGAAMRMEAMVLKEVGGGEKKGRKKGDQRKGSE